MFLFKLEGSPRVREKKDLHLVEFLSSRLYYSTIFLSD